MSSKAPIAFISCRAKFAEYSYLREPGKDSPERVEKTVVFLVDAWRLGSPDPVAREALSQAQGAAGALEAAEAELKAAEEGQEEATQVGSPHHSP
jgi:hypothetical protein